MKHFILTFIFCLFFNLLAFGQANQPSCPQLMVSGPGSPFDFDSDKPVSFVANIRNLPENSEIKYFWTATMGKIVEGQGTWMIKLDLRGTNRTPTVTVEVTGFPENCPNSFSETPVVSKSTGDNSFCPKISVVGGGQVEADSGQPMVFKAEVENLPKDITLQYFWTLTAGEIISGQGTPTIKVDVGKLNNQSVTAAVEIKGLPGNCPNKFSETGSVSRIVDSCLDGYGKISWKSELGYLDSEIIRLRRDADLSTVFKLKFIGKATQKEIDKRISRIANHFEFRKSLVELVRVTFIIIENDWEYTTICHYPLKNELIYGDEDKIIKGADVYRRLTEQKPRRKPKK